MREYYSENKSKLNLICIGTFMALTLASCSPKEKTTIVRHDMNPPWEEVNGYTQVVEANGVVYLSGIACSGESYAVAVPDCYKQLKVILEKLKLSPKNIVKETIYTKSIEGVKEQIPARKAFYGDAKYPAATWIEISRLYLPEMLVEVDTIAVRTE